MAKYKFIKQYSARVTVGGGVGISTKSFNIGDIVEGSPKGNGIEIRIAPHSAVNEGSPSNMSYQELLIVPNENLQLVSGAANIFTPKNIIIGVVAIAAIFGILKVAKVI